MTKAKKPAPKKKAPATKKKTAAEIKVEKQLKEAQDQAELQKAAQLKKQREQKAEQAKLTAEFEAERQLLAEEINDVINAFNEKTENFNYYLTATIDVKFPINPMQQQPQPVVEVSAKRKPEEKGDDKPSK